MILIRSSRIGRFCLRRLGFKSCLLLFSYSGYKRTTENVCGEYAIKHNLYHLLTAEIFLYSMCGKYNIGGHTYAEIDSYSQHDKLKFTKFYHQQINLKTMQRLLNNACKKLSDRVF